jgi:hypothetical protein
VPTAAVLVVVQQPQQLTLESCFRCDVLHAVVSVRCCLKRQRVSRRQRTRDTHRGQCSDFPSCTDRCAQGVAIRRDTPGANRVRWRGAGQDGRMLPGQSPRTKGLQVEARRRLELAGLLAVPPCIDAPPLEPDEDEVTPDLSKEQ